MKKEDPIKNDRQKREEIYNRVNKIREEARKLTLADIIGWTIDDLCLLVRVMGIGMSPLDNPNERDLKIIGEKIEEIKNTKICELHLIENGWVMKFLVSQPENGMGEQEVEIQLKNKAAVKTVAINCSIIYLPFKHKDIAENDILKIRVLNGGICNNPNP